MPEQQYYQPYQAQQQEQQPPSTPPKKNPLMVAFLTLLALAIVLPLTILLLRGSDPGFEDAVSQELSLSAQDAKAVSDIIRKKSEQYSSVADPQRVTELVVADTLDFDQKITQQTTLDPNVVRDETRPASPLIFFPPLGPGLPKEGVRIVTGQEASFVLDYAEFADDDGQINLSQDVILYGPDGRIIREGSFKNFFTLAYDASASAFVPIINKVNIPTRYPEGTYVFEIIVRTAQGEEKVIRSSFDVTHELTITSFTISERVTAGEDIEVDFVVNGFEYLQQDGYTYRLREDLAILQGGAVLYKETGLVSIDESYDEQQDSFAFNNILSTQGNEPGEYTLRITLTDQQSQEVTSYETSFVLE